jgi:hypothetical protein
VGLRRSTLLAGIVAGLVVVLVPTAAAEEPRSIAAASAFSCALKWSSSPVRAGAARSILRITGSCSEGPYGGVLIEVPRNRIAARAPLRVDGAKRCTRPTPRSVRCTMRSATSHVGARIALLETRARRPKVTFFDRAGRRLPWISRGGAASPLGSSPPPAAGPGFPQTALEAEGTFTGGSGGCPVATAFKANFVWQAQGNVLRIDQRGTTHTVSGTITSASANEWTWQAASPTGNERYTTGVVRRNSGGSGFTATADYAFTTTNGCTETYRATFVM